MQKQKQKQTSIPIMRVKTRCRVWSHKLSHTAHHLEHPAHLLYFGMLSTHMDYKTAAIGCLIIGILAYLPQGAKELV